MGSSRRNGCVLLYGATGYTGGLVLGAMASRGLRPVVAGRDAGRVRSVAAASGLDHRTAALSEPTQLVDMLDGVDVVVNAAGPFSRTSSPLVDACLQTGTHYLDLTGEAEVVEELAHRHQPARRRGVLLLPAVGYDVVPSDCLAAHVAKRLPTAHSLSLGIQGLRFMTPGSAKTFVGHARRGVLVRRRGALVDVPPGRNERLFEFADESEWAVGVSLTDVASAYYTTGIPNIDGYYAATPGMRAVILAWRQWGPLLGSAPAQAMLEPWADLIWRGPTDAERAEAPTVIVAMACDDRRRVTARLRTPEPYSLTADTAAAIAARVLDGEWEAGFETPARLFGADFILSFDGVRREDLS